MKYEHRCSYCGRTDHYYAKGLCRSCYDRLRRNGTFEKQYPHGVGTRPDLWSNNTKKILELYRGGTRQADIVKEVGLTRQAVSLVIKKYAKPTNADRIRAMTDEELAEFIGDDPMHDICPNNCHEDLDRPCKVCVLDWLKQEATDG